LFWSSEYCSAFSFKALHTALSYQPLICLIHFKKSSKNDRLTIVPFIFLWWYCIRELDHVYHIIYHIYLHYLFSFRKLSGHQPWIRGCKQSGLNNILVPYFYENKETQST
jgi:hypothetical protein